MTPFMTEDFLLDTEFSRRLYHDYAKDQPIFDYHCHLPPQQIGARRRCDGGLSERAAATIHIEAAF